MSRYAAMFDRCRAAGEGAFGAFLMLGDPDPAASADSLDAVVAGGADEMPRVCRGSRTCGLPLPVREPPQPG